MCIVCAFVVRSLFWISAGYFGTSYAFNWGMPGMVRVFLHSPCFFLQIPFSVIVNWIAAVRSEFGPFSLISFLFFARLCFVFLVFVLMQHDSLSLSCCFVSLFRTGFWHTRSWSLFC